jgi:hypothetical protein
MKKSICFLLALITIGCQQNKSKEDIVNQEVESFLESKLADGLISPLGNPQIIGDRDYDTFRNTEVIEAMAREAGSEDSNPSLMWRLQSSEGVAIASIHEVFTGYKEVDRFRESTYVYVWGLTLFPTGVDEQPQYKYQIFRSWQDLLERKVAPRGDGYNFVSDM